MITQSMAKTLFKNCSSSKPYGTAPWDGLLQTIIGSNNYSRAHIQFAPDHVDLNPKAESLRRMMLQAIQHSSDLIGLNWVEITNFVAIEK